MSATQAQPEDAPSPAPAAGPEPLAQRYSVVWHNPDPEYYVEGSGLVRLDGGDFVAVVPVVPRVAWSEARRAAHSRTRVLRSADGGVSWRLLAELPYYSAVPWTHDGALYLFANKGGTAYRNDDLLLLRSEDGGAAWSAPLLLAAGHFWNCHTGMVVRDGRLYWATDDLSFGGRRGPRAIAGDLRGDPMDARAWRLSNPVPFPGVPDALTNERFGHHRSLYLEPNVIDLYGRLRVLTTVKPRRQSTTGLCAVLDLDDDGSTLDLRFTQYHPMPGGQLKFCVLFDDVSRLFWATVNLAVDGQGVFDWWRAADGGPDGNAGRREGTYWGDGIGGNDRRFLMLLYGLDGLNWFQAGCIARAGQVSQSFMYPRPVIDGDDLVVLARTSVHAPNQHDADYATFHRVRDFRRLAMDLRPQG
jgi:hypothetical protein